MLVPLFDGFPLVLTGYGRYTQAYLCAVRGIISILFLPAAVLVALSGTTENISVARYFERTGRKLRHPEWPCLDLGRKDKPLAVPIEMCRIVEGQRKGTLDAEQTTAMLQQAKKVGRGQ